MNYPSSYRRRNSLRLQNWDYSRPGHYFITICVKNNKKILGVIIAGKMRLSKYGYIVKRCWRDLTKHYDCSLDAFIIMPNHIHGIIIIKNTADLRATDSKFAPVRAGLKPAPTSSTASEIIRGFKTFSARKINNLQRASEPIWQRGYYDHIIRNDTSLERIRNYIKTNPERQKNF